MLAVAGPHFFVFSLESMISCLAPRQNVADRGAAVFADQGNVQFTSSRFEENQAMSGCGALLISGCSLTVRLSVFVRNTLFETTCEVSLSHTLHVHHVSSKSFVCCMSNSRQCSCVTTYIFFTYQPMHSLSFCDKLKSILTMFRLSFRSSFPSYHAHA
jgi:hypothetical protein